ncbi:hypothetical protein CKO51_01595 [Rhodopirellula sp. SM50]|nr:WavE lipopolysaccharide synthesis family protein [Rhodopirellula sp. SM50]PAY21298.1 hypothetical protein CKO51_01595 [Rhodopirellula sp. SM50]
MWKWEWICWFVNLVSPNPAERIRRYRRLIERLSREADLDGGWWRVFRDYPKQAASSTTVLSPGASDQHADESIAVVVQGPVVQRDELTIQTLQLYRQTMPHSRLILSTWNDVSPELRAQIESLGVTVVTSEKPPHPGPHNLNLQIVSTRRGLQEAQRMGCRYAMKTRADTRIHLAEADQFCRDLLNQFPVDAASGQQKRLMVLDFATRLYVPCHPADLLMFGTTDDLLTYWSPELCGPEMTFRVCDEFDEMLQQATPEIVLCRSYLQRTGAKPVDDLPAWWEMLADRFIVIDRDMIDLFWPKYNYNVDQRLSMVWDNGNMALCHFAQWMQLYARRVKPSVTLDQLRRQRVHDAVDEGSSGPSSGARDEAAAA